MACVMKLIVSPAKPKRAPRAAGEGAAAAAPAPRREKKAPAAPAEPAAADPNSVWVGGLTAETTGAVNQ